MNEMSPTRTLLTYRRLGGFTLVEALLTIVILGILTSAALPSFTSFIAGQRIKTASYDIMAMLTLARSEAIKRNSNVTVDVVNGFFTMTAADGTVIRKQEVPTGVTMTGGSTVVYNGGGRLNSSFSALTLSNSGTSSARCITLDLSGRPNSKLGGC